jgi:membrane protein required for colicin V production
MTSADIIIMLLLIIFALGGLRRGFVWELLTAGGLVLGFALTYYYRADLLDLVMRLSPAGWSRQWGAALAFLVFFLIIYLGFAAIGKFLRDRLHQTALKWPDRVLGVAAGAFKGAILIAILVAATGLLSPNNPVRRFVSRSQIVIWGRHQAYDLLHWEPVSKRPMVEEKDEGGRMRDEMRREIRNEKTESRSATACWDRRFPPACGGIRGVLFRIARPCALVAVVGL